MTCKSAEKIAPNVGDTVLSKAIIIIIIIFISEQSTT